MTVNFFQSSRYRRPAHHDPEACPVSGGAGAGERLVIVSNRVADLLTSAQSGGLAVGLADALHARGGIWFGWNGRREGATGDPVQSRETGKVTCVGMPISPADFADYYLGYANSVLWPLFHYRLDLVDYKPAYFEAYMRVNEAFARQLLPFLRPDDLIWIHDYHLLPLADCLRRLGCRQRIGHFQHVPFPPPDLLAAAPHHRELVEALFANDLLGFQTHADVENLKAYLERETEARALPGGQFRWGARSLQVGRFPIGIDATGFAELASQVDSSMAPRPAAECHQIIGVDRLDYSKGLPERFKAMAELLSRHPELVGRVSYLQVASPTREEVGAYARIRAELEGLAGSINGRFADLDWTPIQYLYRSLPRRRLAPLLRCSKVGFVSPLRDGMNLVAKEYVAAQDPDDPGVLVLSKFAGAAEEMPEALLVNPYDVTETADSLYRALTMPLEERRARHAALMAKVARHDAKAWLEAFLAALVAETPRPAVA